jgi:hypothetical protein
LCADLFWHSQTKEVFDKAAKAAKVRTVKQSTKTFMNNFLTKEEIKFLADKEGVVGNWRFLSGFWFNEYIAIVFCQDDANEGKTYVYIFFRDDEGNFHYAFSPDLNYFARNFESLIEGTTNKWTEEIRK